MAGGKSSVSNCVVKVGDNDWFNMEKYVIYNWNKFGVGITQIMFGWVYSDNYANWGC